MVKKHPNTVAEDWLGALRKLYAGKPIQKRIELAFRDGLLLGYEALALVKYTTGEEKIPKWYPVQREVA